MTCTAPYLLDDDPDTLRTLQTLHAVNEQELIAEARRQFPGSDDDFQALLARFRRSPPETQAALLEAHHIAIRDPSLALGVSWAAGRFLRMRVRASGARRILELGSSKGLSTLWLAAALRENGGGELVATELAPDKCRFLEALVARNGLDDIVRVVEGDAFETVATLEGPFDFVFLDLWAEAYLPMFEAIRPLCRPGSVVTADNMLSDAAAVAPIKRHLEQAPDVQSVTLSFESGVEYIVIG